MPTKKQRRRAEKERRHEYETVWVDAEGNELDEPPEEAAVATRERRDDGKPKAKSQQKQKPRGTRVPPEPSWQRAAKRSLILGVAVFAFFYLWGSKGHARSLPYSFLIALLYVVLFIPFTYMIDRMTYRRWQQRQGQGGGGTGRSKKR
ncbi:MAG TPA: hypothetical protein VE088_06810 [Gaiellaceae bacterium]|nr:hypothetical protein [Gaiellaceae bacterium]